MSTNEGSSTSDPRRAGSFPGTTNFEGSSMLIVTDKLNGINYREWAQAVKLAIGGRGKMGFLTGTVQMPIETDVQAFQQWHTEKSLVSSWLINAMTPEIKRSFMFLPTAHEIWEAVRDSYSDGEDLARLFEIKTTIWELKQVIVKLQHTG
ncbi:hypothetical protein L6164_024251 [Bauhinia variegata]|uniref:Uncharacterized protein n=1 Tax=Bauhinia variegata TaxID=167791 RepID=A0ACB9LXW5_BAUVA|nr:hypothetical protein L6164_024251 [Bauhinia variegata]